ncbi:translation initiation factor IF-2 [Teratosphaeriaceae sp. CCFEE 6253]|nr:translation initiation factor IF-2 [Teratosphaeriaceae sp. CCFEE 6253]
MRRQRYLRTSSAQSLCLVCACRLAGDLPPLLSYPSARRRLNTGHPARQQAAAAASAPDSASNSNGSSSIPEQVPWTFDPTSTLTGAEQAERARLRQLRQSRERAQHVALQLQRRQAEEAKEAEVRQEREIKGAKRRKDDAEREQLAGKWRQQQAEAEAAAAAEAKVRVEAAAAAKKRDADAKREASAARRAFFKAEAISKQRSGLHPNERTLVLMPRGGPDLPSPSPGPGPGAPPPLSVPEDQAGEPAHAGPLIRIMRYDAPEHDALPKSRLFPENAVPQRQASASELAKWRPTRTLNLEAPPPAEAAARPEQAKAGQGAPGRPLARTRRDGLLASRRLQTPRPTRRDDPFADTREAGPPAPTQTQAPRPQAQAPRPQAQTPRPTRKDDPFADTRGDGSPASTRAQAPRPQKVSLPSFGNAAAGALAARKGIKDDGWGAGPAQRVERGEAEEEDAEVAARRYDNILAERPVGQNPNIVEADAPTTGNGDWGDAFDRDGVEGDSAAYAPAEVAPEAAPGVQDAAWTEDRDGASDRDVVEDDSVASAPAEGMQQVAEMVQNTAEMGPWGDAFDREGVEGGSAAYAPAEVARPAAEKAQEAEAQDSPNPWQAEGEDEHQAPAPSDVDAPHEAAREGYESHGPGLGAQAKRLDQRARSPRGGPPVRSPIIDRTGPVPQAPSLRAAESDALSEQGHGFGRSAPLGIRGEPQLASRDSTGTDSRASQYVDARRSGDAEGTIPLGRGFGFDESAQAGRPGSLQERSAPPSRPSTVTAPTRRSTEREGSAFAAPAAPQKPAQSIWRDNAPPPRQPSQSAWLDDAQPPPSQPGPVPDQQNEPNPQALTRQPISAETIGSYVPLQPDAHGYRATILKPQDYRPDQPAFDEAQAAGWQHLRRRDSAPPAAAAAAAPQVAFAPLRPQRDQRQGQDTDWIDRQFQAHRQQRPQQSYPAYLDPRPPPPSASSQESQRWGEQQHRAPATSSPFDLRQTVQQAQIQGRKCARCGEAGHIARECTGPNRTVCRKCGEVGHMSFDCPGPGRITGGGQIRRTRSEGHEVFNGREEEVRRDAFGGGREGARGDPFARRQEGVTGDPFGRGWADEKAAPFGAREGERRTPRGGREDAVDDVREGLLKPRKFTQPAENADEEPAERVLRSRKFTEEAASRKEKARGAGRRRDEDDEEEDEGGAIRDERNARKAERKVQKEQERTVERAEAKARRAQQGPPVSLPEFVSVATLAQQLGARYEQFVDRLERLGYDDIFPGKILNAETSGMIAMEYGYEPVFGEAQAAAEKEERDLVAAPPVAQEDKEFLPARPPVVTIMGHVDHGKTTILDYLRKSSVAAGEAGGITQHIGAFSVPLANSGRTITFLDTPGHAAFLAMRQRGANVTDIVILVVAADDSVKPQTLEAIKHAQSAGVPMIVAVNKMDKEGADMQRVKQDLARHGVEIEDFGGETQVVPVSGKTGLGMEELEENVVTLSEILDHRAEAQGVVEGWVLEATTKNSGRVATVLVRRGTLRPGTIVVSGQTWARVKTLKNEAGQAVAECGPGMPVEVDGWRDQPVAGDEVLQAPTEQKATDVVDYRLELEEQRKIAEDMEVINETRRLDQERQKREKAAAHAAKYGNAGANAAAPKPDEVVEETKDNEPTGQMTVPFIIKADVSGSAEAVAAYILSVASPLIAPQILRSTVGPLNASDVELADAARGHIISFNLPPDEAMKATAARAGVKVLENNIIYRVLDDVRATLEERLPEIVSQRVVGEADVGVGFEIGVGGRKKVRIAGCKVRNGVVGRSGRVRVMRAGAKVYDGTISSLKNVKKDVQEMRKGTECGMGFEGWEGFEVGDQVQVYEEIREKRRL